MGHLPRKTLLAKFRHYPIFEVLAKILMENPDPPSQHRPGLDRCLETICRKAMEKAPADRYATMAAFAEALEDFLANFAVGDGSRKQASDQERQGVVSGRPPIGGAVNDPRGERRRQRASFGAVAGAETLSGDTKTDPSGDTKTDPPNVFDRINTPADIFFFVKTDNNHG